MIEVELPDGTIAEFPEGTSQDVIKGALSNRFSSGSDYIGDVAKSFASGVVQAIPDTIATAGGALGYVAGQAPRLLGKEPVGGSFGDYIETAKQAPVIGNILDATEYQPQTRAGEIANFAGLGAGFGAPIGAAVRGTAGVIGRAAGGAKLGAISGAGGEIARPYGGDFAAERYGEDARPYGEIAASLAGGIAAPSIPYAVSSLGKTAGNALVSNTLPKIEQATLAKRAVDDFNIPLSLTQVGDSRARNTLQKISQPLPFSGVGNFEANQISAWNKALSRTIGENSEKITPEVVGRYLKRSGSGFNDVLRGQAIAANSDDIAKISSIYENSLDVMDASFANVVKRNVNNVKRSIKDSGGVLQGEKLASVRSKLLNNASEAQGPAKGGIGKIVEYLDEMAARSLPSDKVEKLASLRREYRNFKTIEPLLEKSTDGTINPAQLLQRVSTSKYIKGSRIGEGQDDIVDLARIGKEFLPKLGGSDTFEKAALTSGIYGTTGAGAIIEPATVVTSLAANRAYQGLYNQSQGLLRKAIEKNSPKRNDIEIVTNALQADDLDTAANILIRSIGSKEKAANAIKDVSKNSKKEVKEGAFNLIKAIKKAAVNQRGSLGTDDLPKSVNIDDLEKSVDGLYNAKSFYAWGGDPKTASKKPISVSITPEGKPYVLDGYHRIAGAQKQGKKDVKVEYLPWDENVARRYADEMHGFEGGKVIKSDLPLDQASRMQRAREMGFDVDNPVYHGTPDARFNEFKPDQFFTNDPNYANRFTSSATSSSSFSGVKDNAPSVIPAYVKTKNVFDTRNPEHAKILKEKFSGKFGEGVLTKQGLPDWVEGRDIAEFLKEELPELGFDSLLVDEGVDALGSRPIAKIVFDPKNIRSVNAKFDPAKADSANLLASRPEAGIAAGALTLGGAYEPVKEKLSERAERIRQIEILKKGKN